MVGIGSQVAIVGAGMVGSYLHRLLSLKGIEADLYGAANGHTACGIHPCAWGSSEGFFDHVKRAEIDPDTYVLMRPDRVNFEGVDLPTTLITFDKPSLIKELQKGSKLQEGPVGNGRYERIIDATGVRRALLPPIRNDVIVPCVQHRMRYENRDSSVVAIRYGNIGYSWSFPLSKTEFHIGGGSLMLNPVEMVPKSGLMGDGGQVICSCGGRVRASSPKASQPFVVTNESLGCEVWGVGESIGAVAPIAGEGVAPGMTCAQILVDSWDNSETYAKRVRREFKWMYSERKILDKLTRGGELGVQDWVTLRNTGRRMGAKVGLTDVMNLLGFLSKQGESK